MLKNSWMSIALTHARLSNDPSVQNAAIIVHNDREIVGIGVNRLVLGVEDTPENWERPRKYEVVEHAERSAIYNAASLGEPTSGATMYCPWSACIECARAIVESGITKLVRFPSGDNNGLWSKSIMKADNILIDAGVEIVELDLSDFIIPADLRLGQFRSEGSV